MLTRDNIAIEELGKYLMLASSELANEKNKFIQDSNLILAGEYEGIDANAIVAKLLETIDKAEDIIKHFDYYSKYLLNLAGYDKENINSMKKKITTLANDNQEIISNNSQNNSFNANGGGYSV